MSLSKEIAVKYQIKETLLNKIEKIEDSTLQELSSLKEDIEKELNDLIDELAKNNAEWDTELLTPEGFPRDDLDVLAIITIKKNINMLRNDLKKVMNCLHKAISNNSELMKKNLTSSESIQNKVIHPMNSNIPFAIFTEVIKNSPCDKAGINSNDKLIQIDNFNAANYKNLNVIKNYIVMHENIEMKLRILKSTNVMKEIILIPSKNWDGLGVLGCKLTIL
ncbi:hypothetical protein Kpol_499p17 [Vanderwaltozyma polyspora DSM 70294]|uniref:Probable 26S proteasome regulatory subunit p27 n=1 Tax=Vanderwaltozyma polyspora (strain ATCC 22028 / DSM 70294 / BCRC 21397 / CBS 2163 / NBRC 10782 / NRRL Y-8283 / UCD 57-17) TaxID=436907 RepID=A7TP20_VANPO|nr:uncharacterized protein Kpol_499p17 [Vanderwaltozyma polyspora DSM 70294]EDO15989.1 hypothetical protein Kpol_499p17 [Vanderwaltozyma polyspora DSM 70294]